jgi:hypothetical protein
VVTLSRAGNVVTTVNRGKWHPAEAGGLVRRERTGGGVVLSAVGGDEVADNRRALLLDLETELVSMYQERIQDQLLDAFERGFSGAEPPKARFRQCASSSC